MRNIKQRVFHLIDEANPTGSILNRIINLSIIILIILSVIETILESFKTVQTSFREEINWFETFIVMVFTLEYILRVWTADLKYADYNIPKWQARLKYLFSFYALIDLLAILPFYAPMVIAIDLRYIRILRVIRLLRVFKLKRYSKALTGLRQIFIDKAPQLVITVVVCLVMIIFSSALMFNLERETQPEAFSNIPETFYWAISTLTTVGYGDVTPITTGGKILAGLISLLGVAFVALPAGILSSALISHINDDEESSSGAGYSFCPHCGQKLTSNP